MTKYNKGDKFLLEVDGVMSTDSGMTLYHIKGFRSLIFDDYGLDRLEKVLAVGKIDLKHDDDIEVGDEVVSVAGISGVVTHKSGDTITVIFDDGTALEHNNADGLFAKVGKRVDVCDALERMKYTPHTRYLGTCSKCKFDSKHQYDAPCKWCGNCVSDSDYYYWEEK